MIRHLKARVKDLSTELDSLKAQVQGPTNDKKRARVQEVTDDTADARFDSVGCLLETFEIITNSKARDGLATARTDRRVGCQRLHALSCYRFVEVAIAVRDLVLIVT